MPDADKATTPAPDPAASGKSETSADAGKAAAPAPDVNSLQAEIQREREARIESERKYANLHSAYGKQTQELGTLRTLRDSVLGGQGEGNSTDGSATVDAETMGEVLATREEVAWMRFRQDHPRYGEFWDEMKELAKDPVVKRTIESYRVVRGAPILDTFATLHNAYNEVRIRRMEKAESQLESQRAEAAAKSQKIRTQATISGDGAASGEGADYGIPYDELMAMDYDQIIKDPRFKQHIDPNDPPRGS